MARFYQNFLNEVLPQTVKNYPEHWRVIYHEAMQSHHLLFDPKDVARFNQIRLTTFTPKEEGMDRLEHIVLAIFKAGNIPAMKKLIAGLKFKDREMVFFYYIRAIKKWRKKVANSLN